MTIDRCWQPKLAYPCGCGWMVVYTIVCVIPCTTAFPFVFSTAS